MAYAQWATITIKAANFNVTVKNLVHQWGKFYSGTKDNEVSPESINGTIIESGNSYKISACGRSDAASGTEGSFDLYDGEVHVGSYYWDCPWGSKTNTSTYSSETDDNYIGQCTGGNLDSGALGNVEIKIAKF